MKKSKRYYYNRDVKIIRFFIEVIGFTLFGVGCYFLFLCAIKPYYSNLIYGFSGFFMFLFGLYVVSRMEELNGR